MSSACHHVREDLILREAGLDVAVRVTPASPNNLAVLYTANRDAAKAERLYAAIHIDAAITAPYTGLVGLLLRQGRFAEADAPIAFMTTHVPRNALLATQRRLLAYYKGDLDRAVAITSLRKAGPNDATAQLGTGIETALAANPLERISAGPTTDARAYDLATTPTRGRHLDSLCERPRSPDRHGSGLAGGLARSARRAILGEWRCREGG